MYPRYPSYPAQADRPAQLPADYYTGGYPQTQLPADYYATPPAAAAASPDTAPSDMYDLAVPETLQNPTYVPGYLSTQIGKAVRVEFFIGSQLTDRVGILTGVGASYILLRELSGAATVMCDLFSIKFVTVIDADLTNAVLIP